MFKNFFLPTVILLLLSCSKTNIKPKELSTDTAKTTAKPKDTTSTSGGTNPNLPVVVVTTFGNTSNAWITAMQSTSQSVAPESYYPNKIAKDSQGNVFILFNFSGAMDVDPSTSVLLAGNGGNSPTILVKYSASGKLLWSKLFNTPGTAYGINVITDQFDNVYCGIRCYDTNTLGFGTDSYITNTPNNTLIIKFSPTGSLAWLREIAGSKVADIATDPVGNIYITGSIFSDFSIYGKAQNTVYIANTTGAESYYWIKYSNSGQYIITKTVTASASTLNATLVDPIMAVDLNQNVYIAGRTVTNGYKLNFPSISGDDITEGGHFIAQYDKDGNAVWFKGYGAGHSISNIANFSAIKTDLSNGIYLLGINSDQNGDLLWKMDSQGNALWSKTIATNLSSGFRSLFIDHNNQVFVSGDYSANPSQGMVLFNHYIFYNKYGIDGSIIYTKNLLGYSSVTYIALYDAVIDNQGNIDMLGYFNGSIKLLNTSGDPNNSFSDLNVSMFVAHFPEQQ